MIDKTVKERIVDKCIGKYARISEGAIGFTKDDIVAGVMEHGGSMEDVYSIIGMASDACCVIKDDGPYVVSMEKRLQ